MKKLILILIMFIPLFAVNLKTGAPIREEAKKGSKLITLAIDTIDFTVDRTYSYWTKVVVVEGSVKDGKSSDHVGKEGWIYTPLLKGNSIGGEGVNVHSIPSPSKESIVFSVKAGAKIKILDTSSTWLLVVNGERELSGWTWEANIKE